MEFFDITTMPVNLWRNGAGETRELYCFPPGTRDFTWRASIASLAGSGEFSTLPNMERVITLLEGGDVMLDGGRTFRHRLSRHRPFAVSAEQPVRAELTEGRMSMNFNVLVHRERCRASVRVVDRTFTTFGNHGGIVLVLSGAWQLGETLLSVDQGAWWPDGRHTLRLLKNRGEILFTEIVTLPGQRVA